MIYDNLIETLADVIQYNYEQQTKFIILITIFILSLIYMFILNPKFQETKNIFIASYRVILYVCCQIYLIMFLPMLILFMNPRYDYEIMIRLMFMFYSTFLVLISIWVFWRLSVSIPFKILGIGKYNKDLFDKNKHFNKRK